MEKDQRMRSDLYRATQMVLPEGEELSKVLDHETFYLRGRYGAVPNIL